MAQTLFLCEKNMRYNDRKSLAKEILVYALTPTEFIKIMMFNIVFFALALFGLIKILLK